MKATAYTILVAFATAVLPGGGSAATLQSTETLPFGWLFKYTVTAQDGEEGYTQILVRKETKIGTKIVPCAVETPCKNATKHITDPGYKVVLQGGPHPHRVVIPCSQSRSCENATTKIDNPGTRVVDVYPQSFDDAKAYAEVVIVQHETDWQKNKPPEK